MRSLSASSLLILTAATNSMLSEQFKVGEGSAVGREIDDDLLDHVALKIRHVFHDHQQMRMVSEQNNSDN